MTQDRVVLVTGGSRGIGRAVVERLASDGWIVAFTSRCIGTESESLVEALAGRARAYAFDLGDRPAVDGLVRGVEDQLGPIAGLVNNAGILSDGLLAMTGDDEWDRVIDLNLGGPFRLMRAVLRGMITRRAGSIVSVSSLSAMRGVAGQTAYSASKAGLIALSASLAREVGRRGIRVNVVVPGFVPTGMTAGLPDETVAHLRSTESLRGGTSPQQVAETIAFLLSDHASAITGQAIVVDAGASA